ncbi:aromatic ring-hydroxylating oxygenase subunit alpha [Acidianus ambivalens]|uniref:Rieske 2Fe-2S domain-containing protein n=1 Tax=Acidianus ambivalens TaxID=2283 RepID=A0A650CWP3_ACIAM|nr:aromatic ring-hydroxylating dioxygenase subunit alpha [Acidianus ambivalens]MQL54415.1 Rieske 2Fe-2S domain-containing protein [Acidianus ambivalens]QGR22236.1 Rieske 2Fe-2S domain-containing protein [Acidianus ambivalens]
MYNEWLPVAFSDDVKGLYEVSLLGKDILIIKKGGKLVALSNRCPHRLAKLSKGKLLDEEIQCPYHGWRFNFDGKLTYVPSLGGKINVSLEKYYIKEKYGIIWISIREPKYDIPYIKEWYDESFRKIKCGPYYINANPFRVLENLLDVSHFPYVHDGYLGSPSFPKIPEYEAKLTEEGVIAENISVWQPNPDGIGEGRYFTYTYKVLRPLFLYFSKENDGKVFSMIFTIKPESKDRSIVFAWIFMNYAFDVNEDKIRKFEDEIISQDKEILETQPYEYYLDTKKEIHVKADKASILYRHYLRKTLGEIKELGLVK